MINIFMYQGSILSTKMVAWATKFHLRLPKFKSGGQHDHQHNSGWRTEILDNFPSERKILIFQYQNWPTEEDIKLEDSD